MPRVFGGGNSMNCPYCGREMEKGRISVSATGSVPIAFLNWYAEDEFENKGLFAMFKRRSVSIKDTKSGYYHNSFHCSACQKVFGEFPAK